MMISSPGDFRREMLTIDRLVDQSATLPEQVFREKASVFHVIDFDEVWSETFFRDVQSLTATAGDKFFTFAVLRPDPEDYYYRHFSKFPLLQFSTADPVDRYITSLHDDPGESPADAIAYHSETILVYPVSSRWAVYGDRNLEIGIVAAMDAEMAASLTSTTEFLRFFTPAEALTELLPPVYGGVVPDEVKRMLVANYGTVPIA
jgi:hypothetical protein